MGNHKKDWFKRISQTFNAFSEESFSAYQKRCLTPLLNSKRITPPKSDVFKALERVPYTSVKIVIIGQDPCYQVKKGNSYATGLAFALNPKAIQHTSLGETNAGRSLKKILRAVSTELHVKSPNKPDTTLETWAAQGVLLLNAALTTRPSLAGTHQAQWKKFVAALVLALNSHTRPLIFVLTCKAAKDFLPLISARHQVFFNYKHPSRCWRVYSTPACKGKPISFFRLTKPSKIRWASVFA
ncbi:MAG: uracil-DNA glycosylase [Elusimicrobiales bacterium]|nr:uracil-DNA glycosylase [Elusimicrobiales bacterium]